MTKNCEKTLSSSNQGILWVSPGDPWSPWTNSGATRAICFELKARACLVGAISPHDVTARYLRGPRGVYAVRKEFERVIRRVRGKRRARRPWRDERDGIVGRVLRGLAPNTPVVYVFHVPAIDANLPIRRFRYMDLSRLEAVRLGLWGRGGLSKQEISRLCDQQQKSLDAAEGVVTPASYTADSIARDFSYPREQITAIGLGPGLARKDSAEVSFERERYEAARILFVGRDWERKGGDMLLKAFEQVRQTVAHATLTIVGPDVPPADDEAIRFIRPLNKGKRADLHRLENLFASSSLFCMPSICEPWGLVYVEAAQAGLPVVGFREWSLPDIVEDGVTGLLTTNRTPTGLAEAMIALLDDPQRASEMGRAAHKRVRDVLDWPHVVDRLLHRVMPEALNGRVPAALRTDSPPANVHAKEAAFRSNAD